MQWRKDTTKRQMTNQKREIYDQYLISLLQKKVFIQVHKEGSNLVVK